MSGITDEDKNSRIKAENEQTPLSDLSPVEAETPDQVSNHDNATLIEIKPIKKSVLSVKTVITLAVLAVLIGGISIITKQFKPSSSMAGMEDMKGMSMEDMMRVDGSSNPTPVKVESIQPGLMEASVRYTGTVRPYLEVTVYPRVGGQLTEYSAYPGSKVKAGQVLARLTATELSDEVEEATTEMQAAKADEQASRKELDEQRQEIQRMAAESTYLETRVERTEQVLLNSGAIARNDFDRQKSEATSAKAGLSAAKVKLERMQAQIVKAQAQVAQAKVKIQRLKVIESYKVITSPITGIVQERMADPGVVVQPGIGILKIGEYSKVRLQANVAQQNLAGVEIGSPIVARIIGNSTKTIKGRVTSIFPKAGEDTRTVTVEAVVDNLGGQILAGQAVEMQIITAHKPNALSVFQAALTESEGKHAVWVLAGKSAKRKFITTGLTNGDRTEVTSGLQPGDLVITSGQERLIENASVAAVDDSGQPVASLSSAVQGNTQIKLVSPQGKAVSGDNQLVLEVQDSKTKKPVQVEGLEVSVTMPMKNSSPMSTDVEVKPDTQSGRFKVNTYLGMSGKWEVTAKVKDKSRIGNSSFTLDNR
ncbi:efflux RND transporter periplasmic adaptor subunit [Nostoc sp. UHCC 0251]|uniref:efflux RND transporter periplasmic adaptor subunit n=1 Tax=Nostoc sp. UHCC 0251 TaxID=3110240 RepID=UPI002B1F1180|nr:efflux RND transporter periplasmic adaptor subunit [Nostoc sp. UHCC 0251]MEA5625203.1 efflux RND transporter periplasmic adaptor subunit [Nostoc sp. UHCC 0251]